MMNNKRVKTSFGLVMGGLLLCSSMVTFVGCSNASATANNVTADKPIMPVIEEVVSDWECKTFLYNIKELEAKYFLNTTDTSGITEQDLAETFRQLSL